VRTPGRFCFSDVQGIHICQLLALAVAVAVSSMFFGKRHMVPVHGARNCHGYRYTGNLMKSPVMDWAAASASGNRQQQSFALGRSQCRIAKFTYAWPPQREGCE